MNLDAAGLWEAVVVPEDAAAAVIAKKDKPARAYLLSALAENLLLQVALKKSAAEVWASFTLSKYFQKYFIALRRWGDYLDILTPSGIHNILSLV